MDDAAGIQVSRPTLARLLHSALDEKELLILHRIRLNGDCTITELVAELSVTHGIPRSTLRYSIDRLRELALIDCGTSGSKGIPASLTPSGRELEILLQLTQAQEFCDGGISERENK